jgi:hypothetical protein
MWFWEHTLERYALSLAQFYFSVSANHKVSSMFHLMLPTMTFYHTTGLKPIVPSDLELKSQVKIHLASFSVCLWQEFCHSDDCLTNTIIKLMTETEEINTCKVIQ